MNEEWKECVPGYYVSNLGHIRKKNILTNTFTTIGGSIGNRGYRYFQLQRDGKRYNYLVHHLVAKHFIGERPLKHDIDHIDRDKLNNHVSNLRYVSHKINMFNHDRVHTDIPQDTENRHSVIRKLYREKHKEDITNHKKEKIQCERCSRIICRGWLAGHTRKCINGLKKSGRPKKNNV